jgi:two-component system NtrC family response regulator
MLRPKVLIIEGDENTIRHWTLSLKDECELLITRDSAEALTLARQRDPHVILVDLDLSGGHFLSDAGIRLVQDLRKYGSQAKIICIGYGGREGAKRVASCGVHDFVTKPVDLDLVARLVRRACWLADVEREKRVTAVQNRESVQEMIGTSENIRRIFDAIRKVATTDVPVLITGESGTGKELTAKAIHERSLRKDGPFVAINCGAIPDNLVESELFGHERGAFTGAIQQKKGKVEYAQGGTLFLDEVGELPYALQVKLLRFLQERTFERVGGRQSIEMDVRIMAATNVNLKQAIERGTFREDLYYRLGVVHINLPPLRDRGEDVLLMATVFLKQAGDQHGKRVQGFTREAVQAIQTHGWPGNVRELSNKIRRAVVMAEGLQVTPEDLDLPFERNGAAPTPSLKDTRLKLEADLIAQAVTLHGGNLSRVAEELGISRPTLYRRLRRFGLFKSTGAVQLRNTQPCQDSSLSV